MARRWSLYLAIGILFGMVDFCYLGPLYRFLDRLGLPESIWFVAWFVLNPGVWLLPVIPIAWREASVTRSRWLATLASLGTWCAGIIAYYLTNAAQLALFGVPGREELWLFGPRSPQRAANWASVLRYDVLGGMIEWLPVAVVGGALVGLVVGSLRLRRAATT